MSLELFSDDWAKALGAKLAESESYKAKAAKWEWPVALTVTADEKLGQPERSVFLDIKNGNIQAAKEATADDLAAASFIFSSTAKTWKSVFEGKASIVSSMMMGSIKLTKGALGSLAAHSDAAQEMIKLAQGVETKYPEGL